MELQGYPGTLFRSTRIVRRERGVFGPRVCKAPELNDPNLNFGETPNLTKSSQVLGRAAAGEAPSKQFADIIVVVLADFVEYRSALPLFIFIICRILHILIQHTSPLHFKVFKRTQPPALKIYREVLVLAKRSSPASNSESSTSSKHSPRQRSRTLPLVRADNSHHIHSDVSHQRGSPSHANQQHR